MRLTVLGCSGGIGHHSGGSSGHGSRARGPAVQPASSRTTAFLIDDDILLDAGSGTEELSVEQLAKVDHIFLTHAHLDHICALPLLIDSVGAGRTCPVVVYALQETIDALKAHIFNWAIWPDFTEIPHSQRPWMRFEPIAVQRVVRLGGRHVRAIGANHTVPAVGYQVACDSGSLIYSGDTWPNAEFWRVVNSTPDLRYLIIETAFSNRGLDLARAAKHLYPVQLGRELEQLRVDAQVLITHLKPSEQVLIAQEIDTWAGRFKPRVLQGGDVLEI